MRATRYQPAWRGLLSLVCAVAPALPGCRPRDSAPTERAADTATAWFNDVTDTARLDFVYDPGPFNHSHMPQVMGSGVALVDLDDDGDLDVYFTNGHADLPEFRGDGRITNRYFRQESDGRFVDATEASGLGDAGYGMGVAVGDIDNDGHRDVYVTNYGPDRLFRNRGDGTFEDITHAAGVDVPGWSCSAAMLDYDRDGYLDVYVTQYLDFDHQKKCWDALGQSDFCGPSSFPPVHDVLLHNNGDGTFTNVSEPAGLHAVPRGAGLGVVCADFNDDGWIDVYVANDGHANNLWVNEQDGTFRDDALIFGTAYNLHGHAEAGMGVVAADFDNDLDLDLFMTHLHRESNTLYRNVGVSGGFVDATATCGLEQSSMDYTGFGAAAADVDLDGDLDLFIANGRVKSAESSGEISGAITPKRQAPEGRPAGAATGQWAKYAERNLFYLAVRPGSFALCDKARPFTEPVEVSRGLAVGDIDRDGDLDALVTSAHSRARLYRNEAPRQGRHWLAVRAVDPRLNRDAIGATVIVRTPEGSFRDDVTGAFSYLSAKEPVAHFGLGESDTIEHVEVLWPDGRRERFTGVGVDEFVIAARGEGRLVQWTGHTKTTAFQE